MPKEDSRRSVSAKNPHRRPMMLRLAPEVMARLDAWAKQMGGARAGYSRTDLIRIAIARALEQRAAHGKRP